MESTIREPSAALRARIPISKTSYFTEAGVDKHAKCRHKEGCPSNLPAVAVSPFKLSARLADGFVSGTGNVIVRHIVVSTDFAISYPVVYGVSRSFHLVRFLTTSSQTPSVLVIN